MKDIIERDDCTLTVGDVHMFVCGLITRRLIVTNSLTQASFEIYVPVHTIEAVLALVHVADLVEADDTDPTLLAAYDLLLLKSKHVLDSCEAEDESLRFIP